MKKMQIKYVENIERTLILCFLCFLFSISNLNAQVPDPDQGLRADWMRGATGLLWLPERNYNGNIEGIRIDDFITQINDLRTIDYVQLPLTSPNIFSPIHVGPHSIIESLWEGDTDTNGDPLNLAVPREAVDDPLLSWLLALRAAGLRTEIYINSYNLLARIPEDVQDDYPNVSDRWMAWCDTNPEAQAFINSQTYHDGDGRRKYMFCYAEFILKEYALRYGDLVDAWCFDSADNVMEDECGDDPASDDINEQRIYQAFAEACRAGNPNAAISFNNSVGDNQGNPFTTATLFDDYTFGHPFGGAGNMVVPEILYTYNFGIIQWMENYNGYAFRDDARIWNDNVVSHFFPKQSATSWNAGNTPCLTDSQFVDWTSRGLINGGAITWGTPLVRTNLENSPILTLQPYALTQFELTDTYLKEFQDPGAPNWSRQYTILPAAFMGESYSDTLVEGIDFWDPEGVGVTELSVVSGDLPSWATITETSPGTWTISGTPTETEATDYTFELRAQDADGGTNREVTLQVIGHPDEFTNLGNGTPVWYSNPMVLANATVLKTYVSLLKLGVDVYDFEDDTLTISKLSGPDWLNLSEVAQGVWRLSGTPSAADAGENSFTFRVSDGSLSSDTEIIITVDHASGFTDLGNGTPVWFASTFNLPDANATVFNNYTLYLGEDYYDYEGDALTITKTAGPDWLNIQPGSSSWRLNGTPLNTDAGENTFTLNLSDGINSSTAEIIITVIPTAASDSNVQIKAAASTNYGINTVATMYSEVQTAPDGMGTFRISIDVTPPTDQAIISGISGGDSTENSWGIGDGTDANQDDVFRGLENEWTESINNIQIIDFNANGGALTTDNVTMFFKIITTVNSQSPNDFVSFEVGGVVSDYGRSVSRIDTIDLELATSVSNITDFAVGVGGNMETSNKWSVEGITVEVDFNGTVSTTEQDKMESFKLFPNPAKDKISFNIQAVTAQVFDLTGKSVILNVDGKNELDISSLNQGLYILKIQTVEGNWLFKKFLKQ